MDEVLSAFPDIEKSVAALKPLHTIKSNLHYNQEKGRYCKQDTHDQIQAWKSQRKGVGGSGLTVVDVKGASV